MNRLHALTDGVYAISMTLLVLELHVPNAHSSSERPGRVRVRDGDCLQPPRLGYAVHFAALIAYITIAARDRTVLR